MSMIVCPNCEQENQADRYYCDHCGYRLVAPEPPPEEPKAEEEPPDTSSLNPFSLPARQPGETGDLDLDNIPDWLRTGEHKIPEGANKQSTDSDWLSDLEDITFNVGQGQSESDDWLEATIPDADAPLEDPNPSGVEELKQWQDGPDNLESDELPDWLADAEKAEGVEEPAAAEPSLTSWLNEDDLDLAAAPDLVEKTSEEKIEGLTSFLDTGQVDLTTEATNVEEVAEDKIEGLTSFLDTGQVDPTAEETSEEKVDLGGLTGFLAELDNVSGSVESSEPDDSPLDLIDPTPAAAEIEAYRRGTDELTKHETPASELSDGADDLLSELSDEWLEPEAEPTLSETELEAFSLFDDEEEESSSEPEATIEPTVEVEPETEIASAPLFEPEALEAGIPEETPLFDLEGEFPPEIEAEPASSSELDEMAGSEEVDLTGFTTWLEEIQEMVQDPAIDEGVNQADLITDPNLEVPETDDDDQTMVNEFLEGLGLDETGSEDAQASGIAELPDWLAEIQPTGTGILPSLDDEAEKNIAPTSDAVPDWLSDIAGNAPAQAADDLGLDDDWLSNLAPEDNSLLDERLADPEPAVAPDQPVEPIMASSAPGNDELTALENEIIAASEQASADDWLSEVMAAGEEPEEQASPTVPDYPDTIVVAPPAKPDTGQLEGVPEELAGADLPDWLAQARDGSQQATPDSAVASEEASEFLSQDDISYSEMPDWLQPEQADFDSALDAALAIQGEEMVSNMGGEWAEMLAELPNAAPDEPEAPLELEQAEIPEWLQELKPDENAPKDAEEPEEVTGVLAGVRGVIDVEPVIALPRQAEPMKLATASGSQQKQAELLRKVAITERAQAVQVGSRRAQAIPLWLRLLLAALLVGALLATQVSFVQDIFNDFFSAPALPAAAADAETLLANVNGQTVLVAIEYTPANSGEMTPIATAMLEQLAAQNNQFVFMSQYPAGVLIGEDLATDSTASQLGYVPGEAVGLREIASCLNDSTCAGLDDFDGNVALILLLTSERTSLQNWVEQVGATSDTPIVAGLSGMLAPLSRPYLATEQLDGAVIGVQEAAAFASDNAALNQQATGQSVATWLVVGLILLGNIFSLFGRDSARSEAAAPVERSEEVEEEDGEDDYL